MKRAGTTREALRVRCPICWSQPGSPCRTQSGRIATVAHGYRRMLVGRDLSREVPGQLTLDDALAEVSS